MIDPKVPYEVEEDDWDEDSEWEYWDELNWGEYHDWDWDDDCY